MLAKLLRFLIGAALAGLTMLVVGEWMFSMRSIYDPLFGDAPMPGRRSVQRLEGSGRASWAAHHIRRERLPAPNERPVILVLGDSMTESVQVDDRDVFTHRLEGALRQSGVPAAVLNAGVSGRSMADYVALGQTYQRLFTPDWVVVQVTWMDFEEALEARDGLAHFRPSPSSRQLEVVPGSPPRSGHLDRILSALPDALLDRFTLAYPRYRVTEFGWWLGRETPWFHAAQSRAPAKAAPPGPALPIAAELELLQQTWHGRVTLLLLTSFNPLGPARLGPAEERIAASARELGLSIVRLDQGFAALPPAAAPYGFDNLLGFNSGHMNRWGHRLAADLLAVELRRIASTNGLF